MEAKIDNVEEQKKCNREFIGELLQVVVTPCLRKAARKAEIAEVADHWDFTASAGMLLHGNIRKNDKEKDKAKEKKRDVQDRFVNLKKLDSTYISKKLYAELYYGEAKKFEQYWSWPNDKSESLTDEQEKEVGKWFDGRNQKVAVWRDLMDMRKWRNAIAHYTEGNAADGLDPLSVLVKVTGVLEQLGQKNGVKAVMEEFAKHYLVENRETYNWISKTDFLSMFSGKGQLGEHQLIARLEHDECLKDGKICLTEKSFESLAQAEADWKERINGWEDEEPLDKQEFEAQFGVCNIFVTKSALAESSFSAVYDDYMIPRYNNTKLPFHFLACAYNELESEWQNMKKTAADIKDDNKRHAARTQYRFLKNRCSQIREWLAVGIGHSLKAPYNGAEFQQSHELVVPVAYMLRSKGPLLLITQDCKEAKILYDLFSQFNGTVGVTFMRIQNGKLCRNKYYGG